ncbi:hypothetical protein AMELA_G00060210 [Ameiurus melas]|uniref:Uncharacterized protein n=1 Tax=Ameiurus melas TaxID=219545 RepID=A0A7J6B3F8_AMEME|nr:hypothetical protein AMELA_G00060210 [Ameiurus melas]
MELRPLCVFLLMMGLIHCITTVSNKGETEYFCIAHTGNHDSEFSDPDTVTAAVRQTSAVNGAQSSKYSQNNDAVTLTIAG